MSDPLRRGLIPEDVLQYRWIDELALAPGGALVAYTVKRASAEFNDYTTDVYLRELATGGERRLTEGHVRASSLAWSPDGTHLAFTVDALAGGGLVIVEVATGTLETHPLEGAPLTELSWSPDGVYLVGSRWTLNRHPGDVGHRTGIPAPTIRVIRRLRYKQEGIGFVHDRYRQIWLYEPASRTMTQLTDRECDHSEPAWSARGDRLAFVALAREQNTALGQGQIFIHNFTDGRSEPLLPGWVGAARSPVWGDDDRAVAFAGHEHPAPTNRRIFMTPYLADVQTRSARPLKPDLDQEVGNYAVSDSRKGLSNITLKWPRGDRWIYFLLTVEGGTRLCRIDTEGSHEVLVDGPCVVFEYSPEPGERVAYGRADPHNPGDLFLWRAGTSERLTQLNPWLSSHLLAAPEEYRFSGLEGAPVHGWLMTPHDFDPARTYPGIVYVHCSMFSWDFSHEFQCLVSAGYALTYFNQRGTTAGYGQAWTRASEGDQGGKDFEETMLGVDHFVARGFVDEHRLGVTGGSCGGFMTNWLVGHTDRFRAAVTQRSISNQVSFFGVSDIGPEGTERETRTHALSDIGASWRQSPLAYVANVTTPLLIIHSDQDHRCPLEQAEQLFAALRWLGKEVEMVIFEGENHGLSRGGRPGNRIERLRRILGWFERHLGTRSVSA